ncbi:17052_t:CDS:2, partial [Gigaspora rosea]
PNVKAKLDSHLLLDDNDKITLTNLLDNKAPGVVKIQWDLSNEEHIRERNQFLYEHGLDLDSDNVKCKWSIRQSTKTKVIKQCMCGSYREKATPSNSRASAARYSYVRCFTFATMFIHNNEICAVAGYLEHSKQCHTLIDNSRTLLTAMDIVNIRKQIIQKNWNINIKNDAAPYTKETNCLEIIICTQEQQQYAWKYGHNNLIFVDGTFGISKHKVLLFIIIVIDENNKGIPYWKNEINKQLGRGGNSNTILQRQTLKAYLKSLLKEAWSMKSDEEMVRNYIKEKKSLESLIYKKDTPENSKPILKGGVKFLLYLEKQWAGDLIYSWCFNRRMRAVKTLGIPLEKLPTTNNHLKRMNDYLKNSQIKRFQRNNCTLRADILYVVLVYKVIPNILTLRNLATNLKNEKEKRQKEFNIMDPSDRKILMQEFPQHEIEQTTGNIYVQIKSETIPQLIYTTCVYGKPTDICCQCLDFLQKGIACKHLCAALFYIDELRKQDEYANLPEIIFATYEEAQEICNDLDDNKLKKSKSASSVQYDSNSSSTTNISDRGKEDTDDEINNQKNYKNNTDLMSNSSDDFFNYMEHIFSISNADQSNSSLMDITKLNAAAIHKQEFKEFLESTSRNLRILQVNSIILQDVIRSKDNSDNLNTLITYLHDIVTSNSFKDAQNLVDVIYEDTNPHRCITSKTNSNIIPLEKETKQQRHESYKS